MERFRLAARAGVTLAGCLLAAGCGATARDTAAVHARTGAAASTASGPAAPAAKPAPTPPARTAPLPISGPCATSALSVAPASHRTLDGLEVERFLATDTSRRACSLAGSPHLTPYGPLSAASTVTSDIAVSQQDFDGDDEGPATSHLDLQPGQAAAFDVAWYAQSPVVCEHATGFGFNVPGDTDWSAMRRVDYRFGPVCDGQIYVSTLRPPAR